MVVLVGNDECHSCILSVSFVQHSLKEVVDGGGCDGVELIGGVER